MDRINQLIKREIGNILQFKEVHDPRVEFVSITYVDTSPDLRNARIGFSVLTDKPEVVEQALQGLQSASKYIRRLVASRVTLRTNPELHFMYDDTIKRGVEMDQLLDDIKDDRQEKGEE